MREKKALARQWTAACVAGLSVVVVGTTLGWPSPVLLQIQETGQPVTLSTEEVSWMVSVLYLGNLISPLPSGHLMDKIGRKSAMLVLTILPISSWVIIYFANRAWHLYIARFLAGAWSGTVITVAPMYLAEISQPRIRGALSTLVQVMQSSGIVIEYLMGPLVSYGVLTILSGAIAVLFIVTWSFMPESPFWLMAKGRHTAASKSLAWLRGCNPAKPEEVLEELDELEQQVKEDMENVKSFQDLFASPGNRKGLLIVEFLAFIQRVSGVTAMTSYASTTLPQRNIGFLDVNDCVLAMGFVWIFSTFIATFLVDSLGRKPLLLISCIGCTVSMFMAGLWFFLDDLDTVDVSSLYWIPFVCFIIFGFFYSIGLGPVASTVQGEYFSQNIKGLASGVTSFVLALTSFVMNKIYHKIAEGVGMYLNYWIFSGGCLVGALFVYFVVIETKGKGFHSIQEKLNRVSEKKRTKSNYTYEKAPVVGEI